MEIPGPTSGIPQAVTGKSASVTPQWQIGQQLQATVLENSTGKLLLAIGNRQVSAETSLPFDRGQALTLEVRDLGRQPVLRVIAALQESPVAMAVRTLLPRHGATTPLLASLAELVRTPNAPVPPLVREVARVLVNNLPSVNSLSGAAGVKTAVQNSGLFLENRLLQTAGGNSDPVSIQSDFKANLVRLVQLVRNWPGATPSPPPTAGQTPSTLPAGVPIAPPSAGQAGISGSAPTAAPLRPGPLPGAPATAIPSGSSTPPATTSTPPPGGTPSDSAGANRQPPAATPDQVQRSLQSGQATPPGPARATATGNPLTPTASLTTGGAATATPATGSLNPPPPFAGVVPAPQAPVQASLDLINRLGNLRLDLLQQTEAALARVQLGQLTALPRDAERGLIEWLFDIPVRRGEDLDLWSARLYRDADGQDDNDRRQTAPGWSIQLAFDLPGLGPMQAQIHLRGEQVSTHFWTTEQATLPLLRENLDELRQAMLSAGLEVGEIDCQAGRIPDTPGGGGPPLISEKA